LIPVDSADPTKTYRLLRKEIENFSEELSEHPHCVVFTKKDIDICENEVRDSDFPEAWGVFELSSISKVGIKFFLESVWERTQRSVKAEKHSKKEDFWEF
jgi:GTPase involved in cell partitioning and DNA repair